MARVKEFHRALLVLLVVFGAFEVTLSAPPSEHNGRSFRNALNQQGVQTILQSIEERLRNLDHIYSIRYSPRSDLNTDQFVRKIDMLETKLSRLETLIEAQLEKLSENMSSRNFKDDIAKDQIFRKIDSVYERINHKLNFIEGKFDMDVMKLQSKIEIGLSKMDRLEHSMSVRQADMELEISEGVQMMENVKNSVTTIEQKLLNVTKHSIESLHEKHVNLFHTKFNNITNAIMQVESKLLNISSEQHQKDFLNDFTNKDMTITKTIKGYEDTMQSYGNKVNNMYNELWKKSNAIENTVKNSAQLMNITRKEIQDNMSSFLKKPGSKYAAHNNQNDGALETIIDSVTNTFHRKFSELGRKLESNFENLMLTQNLFLESCHRIQIEETQLENKISLVLEKLLDTFTNKSLTTFKELQNMEEMLKLHDAHIHRSINQNTNTVIKLSEKTSEDRKKIEKILSTIKKDVGTALATIQNESNSEEEEKNEKLNIIGSILLELQAQVNDLDGKMNKDNINYNAKQMLQDLLLQTKDTFMEQVNISALHNTETIAQVDRFLKNIYPILNNIDIKINKCDSQLSSHKFNSSGITSDNKPEISNTENSDVEIILNILPDKNNIDKNILLSIFNYSIIEDKIEGSNLINNSVAFSSNPILIKLSKDENDKITNRNVTANLPVSTKNETQNVGNSNFLNEKITNIVTTELPMSTKHETQIGENSNLNLYKSSEKNTLYIHFKTDIPIASTEFPNISKENTDIVFENINVKNSTEEEFEEKIINKNVLKHRNTILNDTFLNKNEEDIKSFNENITLNQPISTNRKSTYEKNRIVTYQQNINERSKTDLKSEDTKLTATFLNTNSGASTSNMKYSLANTWSKEENISDTFTASTIIANIPASDSTSTKTENSGSYATQTTIKDRMYDEIEGTHSTVSPIQDSFEYFDLKNSTNDDNLGGVGTELPDIQEYDEDYDEKF